jgi:hypothetical protein
MKTKYEIERFAIVKLPGIFTNQAKHYRQEK